LTKIGNFSQKILTDNNLAIGVKCALQKKDLDEVPSTKYKPQLFVFVQLRMERFEAAFQEFLDFGQEGILDAVQIQALQLNHTVTVTTGMFLNPVAHGSLTVLNTFLQDLLDIGRLHRHVALHIKRKLVCADELLQVFQQGKVLATTILDELAQFIDMTFKKGRMALSSI
jgi:hypothetical protein